MSCKGGSNCCKNRQTVQPFKSLATQMGRPHDLPRVVKIVDIKEENAQVRTFTLDLSVGAHPGQFVLLWIPRLDEKPFSVAFDDGQKLELSIAKVGPFTEALFEKKVGDQVGIRGPFGKPFYYELGDRLATIGGGYGAAPLYFLAHQAVQKGCTVEFIVGGRSKDHLLFIERAAALPSTQVHVSTDDGSQGFKGYNVQLLNQLFDEGLALDRLITVGPERMMKAVSDVALEKNLECIVSVERYMKCGFGICGQCVIDESGMPTCMEGPAMDHKLARRQKEFGQYHRDALGKKHSF